MSSEHVLAGVAPPEIPLAYVTLELDLVTRNLMVNHEPLRVYLKKLVGFFQEGLHKGYTTLQREVDLEIAETKKGIYNSIAERIAQVQDRLDEVSRATDIRQKHNELRSAVESLEQRLETHLDRFETFHEEMQRAVEENSTSRRISLTPSSANPGHRRISMSLNGSSPPPVVPTSPASPGHRGSASRASNKGGGSGAPPTTVEMQEVHRILRELVAQNEACFGQIQLVEEKFDGEFERINGRIVGEEERNTALAHKADEHGDRFAQLEEAFANQEEMFADTHARIDHVTAEQADRVKLFREELNHLGALVEKHALVADLAPRVSSLERSRRQTDMAVDQAGKHVQALQRQAEQASANIGECSDAVAELRQHAESDLTQRCSELAARDEVVSERVIAVEERVVEVIEALQGLDTKAENTEVAVLRNLLGALAEDLKEKEPSVLFGARCLSCNRVFDEVDKSSGVVNHKLEKQRAQVLAEIQRVLHSPRCDPLEPINLLAVKVGRPSGIKGATGGMYAGRDNAGGLLRGIEDVALLPVRHVSATVPDSRGISPPSVVQPAPPSGRPSSGRAHASPRAAHTGRPLTMAARATAPPGQLATLREVKPKEITADFKHPLSELLGRPERRPAAATAPPGGATN